MLKEVTIQKFFIPGEHDWYLDMGKTWMELFGELDLDLRPQGRALHRPRHGQPRPGLLDGEEHDARRAHGPHGDARRRASPAPWAGVGREQLDWLEKTLSDWGKDKPVIIFTHNPLYEYYPPWNFWVRDWREVHEILKPYTKVTNIHGHIHQVLYNEIGTMRSIGMLATSWPWPYAPEGVPKLDQADDPRRPGRSLRRRRLGQDDVGANDEVENEYMMWRKEVFVQSPEDSRQETSQRGHPAAHRRQHVSVGESIEEEWP